VVRRRGSRTRTVYRNLRGRARRPRKNDFKRYGTKALKGGALGMAISIPLTLLGRHMKQPLLIEAGQRFGSIASTVGGGTIGNATYQALDATFDRVVMYQGGGISGSQGQVYL